MPVYNCEKYLVQCLDSVISQSLTDIEIICVDDGSTDGSAAILEEYAGRDERIRVIAQVNSGAGAARNTGLEAASGEYVLFLDGDDMLLPGSLESLYKQAESLDVDIIRCRAVDYDNETGEKSLSLHNHLKRVPFFLFDRNVQFSRWYWLFPKLNAAPWGGLCRREFLIENDIRFNDLVCVNDRSFYWETVLKANRIAFSRTELLLYRMNMSTSLVGGRIKNFECHFKSYAMIEELCSVQPQKVQRCILDGEMLDIANWLEKSRGTEYEKQVAKQCEKFISSMDLYPWNGKIDDTGWNKRINK